jgi:hypothetical protein
MVLLSLAVAAEGDAIGLPGEDLDVPAAAGMDALGLGEELPGEALKTRTGLLGWPGLAHLLRYHTPLSHRRRKGQVGAV